MCCHVAQAAASYPTTQRGEDDGNPDDVRQLLAAANYVHVPTLWADDSPRYRVAAIQGEVVAVRPDEGCSYMDPISVKYTGARPFPAVVPIGCVCDRGGEGGIADAGLRPSSGLGRAWDGS